MVISRSRRRSVLRSFGQLLLAGALVCGSLHGRAAEAIETGITGYSGKQFFNCSQCHDGGLAPFVSFEGPTEVAAGETATFRFVLQSRTVKQPVAGFNVAASGGTLELAPEEDDARLQAGELTHVGPKAVDDELMAMWTFLWRAPLTPGSQTLFGSGLSGNDDLTRNGDQPESTALVVDVVPGPPRGDANCDDRLSAADLTGVIAVIGGAAPGACNLTDATCDEMIDADDVTAVVAALFDPQPSPCL